MPWSLLAAVAAGLAILAWRGDPGGRLRAGRSRVPGADGPGPDRRRLLGALGAGASALLLVVGLGGWGLLLAPCIGVASYLVLGTLSSAGAVRRDARLVRQLPQACDLLAVCLEAGLPLRAATDVVAGALDVPLADVLAELSARVRLGAEESSVWAEIGEREPALASLGREVARALGTGLTLARRLRALGVDARRDAASLAEVSARRVGVRSVLPLMLCFLPAFLLLGVVPIIGGVAEHLLR